MAEFNIQSDSVDVAKIMEQIRQRIREKRGEDYTEQQIRELATVKLEKSLDPQQVRSDLVEHYRQLEPPGKLEPIQHEVPLPAPEAVAFDRDTIYVSSRGSMGKLIRLIRKILNPILMLFFNPDRMVSALMRQAEINAANLQILQRQTDLVKQINTQFERAGRKFAAREELDALNYEVLNNLVVEMTRLAVDMKNHRVLVESVAGRLDFGERRTRALESVLQSRSPASVEGDAAAASPARPKRRRRRPRRRPEAAIRGTGVDPVPSSETSDQKETTKSQPATESSVPSADKQVAEPEPSKTGIVESPASSVTQPSVQHRVPSTSLKESPDEIAPPVTPTMNTAVENEPHIQTTTPDSVSPVETVVPPFPKTDTDSDKQ